MKMLAMFLALGALQDRLSPDLLDYQPSAEPLRGNLEVGPANGLDAARLPSGRTRLGAAPPGTAPSSLMRAQRGYGEPGL